MLLVARFTSHFVSGVSVSPNFGVRSRVIETLMPLVPMPAFFMSPVWRIIDCRKTRC